MTVQQEDPNPFRRPPRQSDYERMRQFLYNDDEGTVCGRDAKNWGEIYNLNWVYNNRKYRVNTQVTLKVGFLQEVLNSEI